jgi:hypothetical protein
VLLLALHLEPKLDTLTKARWSQFYVSLSPSHAIAETLQIISKSLDARSAVAKEGEAGSIRRERDIDSYSLKRRSYGFNA